MVGHIRLLPLALMALVISPQSVTAWWGSKVNQPAFQALSLPLRPKHGPRVCSPDLRPALASRRLGASRAAGLVRMVWRTSTQDRFQPSKVFPLINGVETLIIGKDGWFISSLEGDSVGNFYGDQAIPLELADQVAWILYRNGEVILTITEDELDVADPLTGGSYSDPLSLARSGGIFMEAVAGVSTGIAGVLETFSDKVKPEKADAGFGFRLAQDWLLKPKLKEDGDQARIRQIAIDEQLALLATPSNPVPFTPSSAGDNGVDAASSSSPAAEEACAEALRLLEVADASLSAGAFDEAFEVSLAAMGALKKVESLGGSVSMEQVKRIVEIKVISDVQRKTLPAAASTPAVAAEVVAEPDQSREALSKQDENNTAQQSKSAGSKAVTGGGVKEGRVAAAEVGSESKGWKDAKDRGVQLDKEARQAMKEARYADAGMLCKKAAEAWTEAAANGFRKGGTYVKASMVMLERSTAAQMMVLEQKSKQEARGGKRGGFAKNREAKMEEEGEVREKQEDGRGEKEEEERFRKAVEEEVKARVSVEVKKQVERAVKARLGTEKKLMEERAEKERKEAAEAASAAAAAVRDELQREKSKRKILADLEEARQMEKKWAEEQDRAERERRERESKRAEEAAAEGLRRRKAAMDARAARSEEAQKEFRAKQVSEELERVGWLAKHNLEAGTKVLATWYEDGYEYEALVLTPTCPETVNLVFMGYDTEQETRPSDIRRVSDQAGSDAASVDANSMVESAPPSPYPPPSPSPSASSPAAAPSPPTPTPTPSPKPARPVERRGSQPAPAMKAPPVPPVKSGRIGTAVWEGKGVGADGGDQVGEREYPLDTKYHGLLLGKQGATVKAMQQASGASIVFKKEGTIVIKGSEVQRQKAWALVTSVKEQLPRVLNTMRGNSIKKGELVSKPELEGRLENKDEVWNLAVGEVIARTNGKDDDSKGGG